MPPVIKDRQLKLKSFSCEKDGEGLSAKRNGTIQIEGFAKGSGAKSTRGIVIGTASAP